MNDEVRANLQELSTITQNIGVSIGSETINAHDLSQLSDVLKKNAKALDIYAAILSNHE